MTNKNKYTNTEIALATILAITILVVLGWWSYGFETHTLAWLSFMLIVLGVSSSRS